MLEDTGTHRRQTDHALDAVEEKIIKLIEDTGDNKDKAYLLILMKLNDSIITNTNNVNKVANKLKDIVGAFDSHVKREEAILNRTRGWRDILVWVLGLVQAVGIWALVHLNTELKDIKEEQVTQKVTLQSHIQVGANNASR